MLKAELRQAALRQRRAYLAADLERRSQQVGDLFLQHFPLHQVRLLHVFLPIGRQQELNTWPLIGRLREEYQALQIAVPVADLIDCSLTHYLLRPDTVLAENSWGITEPVGAQQVAASAIDLVLVPLLAFDLQGNRLGYGKGFYDRFLAECRSDVLKVGLALEPPVALIEDTNTFDVKLDMAVTPEWVYRFRPMLSPKPPTLF